VVGVQCPFGMPIPTIIDRITGLEAQWQFLLGSLALLLATQVVVVALNKLERHQFGTVQLGTLFTPLCTGFPNIAIGLFGQERLQQDLVVTLNMGNNIANTSLVVGLILFMAGPLLVREKGRSKRAKRAHRQNSMALVFLWLGLLALGYVSTDGRIDRLEGALMIMIYAVFHLLSLRQRGKVTKSKRLGLGGLLWILLLLTVSALIIQGGIWCIGLAMESLDDRFPGSSMGLFLGLLTVIPESFLLLRLAFRKGSLGLSGLIGDCLVSVPLVIGLSAALNPLASVTPTGQGWVLYAQLVVTMTAFSLLSFRRKPVPRRVGLVFMALYAMVWLTSNA